ncbi:hypothetical protein IC006_0391 [Sulfuracidifex tepidarius]|uniref:Uncharacterized protein n=2 Tax=Sulfuracidifex tepidarius TaxID=1294262 RepID=A0A510DSL1_9CREN|nr:hypothetical protein [Sulfuracidifex tepidarius]BBG23107.1 hypothetical protein IC006_0391 [Sulfuracidifex tepidarius]
MVKKKSVAFLMMTRYSKTLIVVLSISLVLSVVELSLFFILKGNPLFQAFLSSSFVGYYAKYYFVFLLVPQIFFISTPTKADAFNFFTLPLSKEEIYDSWASFQFISRFTFTLFLATAVFLTASSPLYPLFSLEFSGIGACLSSVSMIGRKAKVLLYVTQAVEVALLLISLRLSVVVSFLLLIGSLFVFVFYRSRYSPVEFLSSIFEVERKEVKEDNKITLKGQRSLLLTRLYHPLIGITFNASGQIRIVKPRIDGRVVLLLTSVVTGGVVYVMSHFIRANGFIGDETLSIVVLLAMYFSLLIQSQWIVVGTLAYERPWILAQTLGIRFIRDIHVANLANLTLSWALLFLVVGITSPRLWELVLLVLPVSWFVYLLLFPLTALVAPNLVGVADGSQPYQNNVRNLFGLSTVMMFPFILLDVTGILYAFLSNPTPLIEVESVALTILVASLFISGNFKDFTIRALSEKGYL